MRSTGERLPSRVLRSVNRELGALGPTFLKPGAGLSAAAAVLSKHGLEIPGATLTERWPDTLTYRVEVAQTNRADPFSPGEVEHLLVLSVYWRGPDTDNYEILAYLS